jgi:hypothetical protein
MLAASGTHGFIKRGAAATFDSVPRVLTANARDLRIIISSGEVILAPVDADDAYGLRCATRSRWS